MADSIHPDSNVDSDTFGYVLFELRTNKPIWDEGAKQYKRKPKSQEDLSQLVDDFSGGRVKISSSEISRWENSRFRYIQPIERELPDNKTLRDENGKKYIITVKDILYFLSLALDCGDSGFVRLKNAYNRDRLGRSGF
jgi:hypothetical protein